MHFGIAQAMVHLNTSRSGLACAQFDAIERSSKDSAARVLAAFNLGVAAATAGELSRAEAAFTRALANLATTASPRDIYKVLFHVLCGSGNCRALLTTARGGGRDLEK